MSLVASPLSLRVGCEFRHSATAPVPAIFVVRPAASLRTRLLEERWAMTPTGPFHDYTDVYGNVCRRVTLPAGQSTVLYDAHVVTDGSLDPLEPYMPQALVEDLPDDVLLYTLPSRYCLSDELADRAWELFGGVTPGWPRVQAICDFVHGHIRFGYGSSTTSTTSSDVLAAGRGVCRDYAHLAIAFCRALSIPARYAFGYLPDIDVPPPNLPMDFCAWFEVYLGGRWFTFDARNNERRRGRVMIARGRDALDVAMVTTFGAATFEDMTVTADEIAA
jgi:transglutaminase-like putative cysteine protease